MPASCVVTLTGMARPHAVEKSERDDRVTSALVLLIGRLALDSQLAELFERTPGKVAHSIGIPFDLIADVLAAYWEWSVAEPGDG